MKKKFWEIFRIVWFSLVLIFFIWNWTTFQSHNLPKDTFLNSDIVSVIETNDEITFYYKINQIPFFINTR